MSGAGNSQEKSTYVPLFRGIEPYLWVYSPAAITVYLWLLIRARFKGDERGTVTFALSEIQDGDPDPSGYFLTGGVNLSPKTIRKALEELSLGYLSNVPPGREAPPFIEIIRMSRGRGVKIKVRILKAKLSARDFHKALGPAIQNQKPKTTPEPEKRDFRGRDTLDDYIKKVSSGMDTSGAKR